MNIVSWNTTNACNMYCAHCYRDAGCKSEEELSTVEAKVLLEQIKKKARLLLFPVVEADMSPHTADMLERVCLMQL